MKIKLVRILGNDLPPRHGANQTIENLKFIIEHESDFPNCQKIFILNRIIDQGKAEEIRSLLDDTGFYHLEIPFNREHFKRLKHFQARAFYITNLNNARNFALAAPQVEVGDILLPLDGGCFFDMDGWAKFVDSAYHRPQDGYFAIPMSRCETYDQPLDGNPPKIFEDFKMGAGSVFAMTEPQIAFVEGMYDEIFDAVRMYGQVPKVELLWRLGVMGIWDRWFPALREQSLTRKSKFFGQVVHAGWVYRLPSGNVDADQDSNLRGRLRDEGLTHALAAVDELCQM